MVQRLNDQILPQGVKIVPYLDRDDLVHYTTHTVLHNLLEGMILVVIVLFIFLGNVRGAIIVAMTIPFSLLFASICLDLRHISANLLSLGALDFGMVVDGAVVMVENIVRHLNRPGCRSADDHGTRSGPPRMKCSGRSFTPLPSSSRHTFRFSRCNGWKENCSGRWPGRSRSPCLARCIFSMLVAPALASFSVQEECQTMAQSGDGISHARYRRAVAWAVRKWRWLTVGLAVVSLAGSHLPGVQRSDRLGVSAASRRGRHLGARHAGPQHGTDRRAAVIDRARQVLCSFPEVPQVVTQVGRPDDGTDTTGFFNTEYFVDLLPKEKWRPVFHQDKERLIAAMDRELEKIPGAIWKFSQPISDNLEEAVSGVKGALAVKIYGDDLKTAGSNWRSDRRRPAGHAGHRRPGPVSRTRPTESRLHRGPRSGGPVRHQCIRCAGCYSDRRWRQRPHPGAHRRATLRSRPSLSAAISRYQGGDREDPIVGAVRRTCLAGAVDQRKSFGRRFGDLPRS